MAPGKFSPGLGRAVSKWSACAVELFFTGLMDISDGHRADNPEDSCASVKRSQIAPYGAVWPFHLCLWRACVCVGGGIFLLLAQNLISILRKMHQHSLSVPQNRPCHAEPPNESRSDSESTHSFYPHWRSSFEFEWAARLCWGGSNKGCSKYAIRWLSADWIVSPWLSYHKLMLWSSL